MDEQKGSVSFVEERVPCIPLMNRGGGLCPFGKVPLGTVIHDGLSEREQEVLSCLACGLANKDIGLTLGISHRTVQKHLQRIYCYFSVHTRTEAIHETHRSLQKRRVETQRESEDMSKRALRI